VKLKAYFARGVTVSLGASFEETARREEERDL